MNNLLIIFAKNIKLGKVKTRLAKTIGDQGAFEVYKHLVGILEESTSDIPNCEIRIYFSDVIIESKWIGKDKFVQKGDDLGDRMLNAFIDGFNDGYANIVGVGADIPDLNADIIKDGFAALKESDTVFGPAEDGGYYLVGMNKLLPFIFENKTWSTDNLLDLTVEEIITKGYQNSTLVELNDIDTLEDLKTSSISKRFEHLFPIVT